MDKSYITFDVRNTSEVNPLGIEVLLDDVTLYNNDAFIGAESMSVELSDDEAEHSLKIVLKNKTAEHTVLDHLGAIVQDSNIIIENIKFDDISVGFNILQSASYWHDGNGTDQLKENKFYGTIGCNGTVELKFSTPIYLWLLENI